MIEALLAEENIVHLAAAFYLAGFLFRDQIMLRALIIAGDLVYILYFLLAPDEPLWGGIFWSFVFMLVNAWMIACIIGDRLHFRMSDDERRLYRLLDNLTPGEFRRFVRTGTWHVAEAPVVLTEENRKPDRLHYVLEGTVTIDKAGRRMSIPPETFIGEVAFLLSRPASATVTVGAGTRYIAWEASALSRLLMRAPSLRIALTTTFNRDMAGKVARA